MMLFKIFEHFTNFAFLTRNVKIEKENLNIPLLILNLQKLVWLNLNQNLNNSLGAVSVSTGHLM